MKKITPIRLKARALLFCLSGLVVFHFAGCKKSADEVDQTLIESKLTGSDSTQYTIDVLTLTSSVITPTCKSTTAPREITFFADHTYKFKHSVCKDSGTWTITYYNNRAEQSIQLGLISTINASNHEIAGAFQLKYDSESDKFYYFETSTLTLYPLTKN
ncbi:MAG: hypothetical protein JWO58_2859 [Chitinophagaceae bacterium]|nr:hypothetical protein [Chitinophagaceae bacterium]